MNTKTSSVAVQPTTALAPQGASTGVAFDWGFALYIVGLTVALVAGAPVSSVPPGTPVTPVVIGALALASVMFGLGQALRLGRSWARIVQIIFHTLVIVIGILSLPELLQFITEGRYGFVYTLFLQFVVSAIEIWLLMQPGSRQWYGHVSMEDARARHSGRWLVSTIMWAVVSGLLAGAVELGVL